MKKEIADKWIAALPKYKQGLKALRRGDTFCCLGVLCELAVEDGVIPPPSEALGNKVFTYGEGVGRTNYLPYDVWFWAGMKTSDGSFDCVENRSLVNLNDNGFTFEQIAKVIEEHWEEL